MKTKILVLLAFCYAINAFAQIDGWHLFTKASEITKILPDDVNADELHLATDIGYIKYNTSTDMVVDFLNLTSQNPAIGNVKDIALDPTSNDIALALKDGIAIYDGLAVTVYSYDNSNLTIGEFTSEFISPKVDYAKDGSLYIYKEDALGYQKFNNGSFETEMITSFRPQDIVENSDGTKAYFAGDNNGLWELDKTADTWANYTTSNSDLFQNFLTSLCFDSSDNLYVGNYQGIDKLDTSGSFTSCNDGTPIPVFDININPINGELLVRNSRLNSASNFGLSIVDFDSCSWTNYREDGLNCLNENVYSVCSYGGNGLAYVAPRIFSSIEDIGKVYEFTVSTESCSEIDINYLNAPVAINSNVITDFAIRKKANGNLEMGFNRTNDLHMVEIDPTAFNGSFPEATTIAPYPGNYVYSIISDNNYFIVETNEGWIFIDENNVSTTFNHSIPDYLAFITKKAANYDSENGIVNIVHKGFDAAFNIRVYKTQCDTTAGTCATSEEIFTTNRDLTQNVLFDVNETSSDDDIHAVGLSLDTSTRNFNNNNTQQNSNLLYNEEFWNKNTNGPAIVKSFTLSDIILPNKDPLILRTNQDAISTVMLLSDSKTIRTLTENQTSNEIISRDFSIDQDNDGEPDEIINSFVITTFAYSDSGNPVLVSLVKNDNGTHVFYSVLTVDNSGDLFMDHVMEQQGPVSNNESGNLTVRKTLFVEESAQVGSRSQNNHTATMAMLTNYGLLIKTDVDLSQLTLSTEETIVQQNEVLIYPNPSNNIVSFSKDTITSAAIFDSNGRHIKDVKSSRFSIKELARGVYIVKAKTSAGVTITRKLIKN